MGANVDAPEIAGRMTDFVRQIQRERMGRSTVQPTQKVPGAQEFQNLLTATSQNEQEQNAAPAPGALQNEGSQEQGRQRNVGQGKTQGRLG